MPGQPEGPSRTVQRDESDGNQMTRLYVAMDESVVEPQASRRLAFALLRFDFCDARIAFPRRRVRPAWQPDPDAFPVEICPRSARHHDMASDLNA